MTDYKCDMFYTCSNTD